MPRWSRGIEKSILICSWVVATYLKWGDAIVHWWCKCLSDTSPGHVFSYVIYFLLRMNIAQLAVSCACKSFMAVNHVCITQTL